MTRRAIRLHLMVLFLALPLYTLAQISKGQSAGRNSKSKDHPLHTDGGPPLFKAWLEQDVVWIIMPEEIAAFKALQNDKQRDQFVEAFWQRRDPTRDTYEDEFKDEHYRRIAYANDHFGWEGAGWKTDRGRIYIAYGPPDRITTYSALESRPLAQDGQDYKGLPSETWSYRYLEGVGIDVVIDFVDACNCGDYRMRMPHELRDALLYIPDIGIIDKKVEKANPDLYLKGVASPTLKFRDLAAMLESKSKVQAIPLEVSSHVEKATDVTSIVRIAITLRRANASSLGAQGTLPATLNVVGRFKTLIGHEQTFLKMK